MDNIIISTPDPSRRISRTGRRFGRTQICREVKHFLGFWVAMFSVVKRNEKYAHECQECLKSNAHSSLDCSGLFRNIRSILSRDHGIFKFWPKRSSMGAIGDDFRVAGSGPTRRKCSTELFLMLGDVLRSVWVLWGDQKLLRNPLPGDSRQIESIATFAHQTVSQCPDLQISIHIWIETRSSELQSRDMQWFL